MLSYLVLNNQNRETAIEVMTEVIRESGLVFDSIVCAGLSGAIVAPSVAAQLGKNLVIVRKTASNAHGFLVETDEDIGTYVIVDDFVDSGQTIEYIIETCKQQKSVCAGLALYQQYMLSDAFQTFRKNWNLWIYPDFK